MEEESAKEERDVAQSMQESWLEVSQQGMEGALVHSHSREEMEQLLADAASEEELSDTDLMSSPRFRITAQPSEEEQVPQVSERAKAAHRIPEAERLKSSSRLRTFSFRRTGLFGGEVLQFLFPVLILTHLAMFGLGFYIGRRIALVKAV